MRLLILFVLTLLLGSQDSLNVLDVFALVVSSLEVLLNDSKF